MQHLKDWVGRSHAAEYQNRELREMTRRCQLSIEKSSVSGAEGREREFPSGLPAPGPRAQKCQTAAGFRVCSPPKRLVCLSDRASSLLKASASSSSRSPERPQASLLPSMLRMLTQRLCLPPASPGWLERNVGEWLGVSRKHGGWCSSLPSWPTRSGTVVAAPLRAGLELAKAENFNISLGLWGGLFK